MILKRFLRSEDGYALVLTLVFLPAFLGLSLLMIDIARGNNAHSDLQAAVDAVALAGARELDGEAGAIARARAAMARPENTVGLLEAPGGASSRTLIYQGPGDTRIRVDFLRTIPASDDTPIDGAWVTANTATTDAQAAFVHVTAVLNEFEGLFPRVAGIGLDPVRIGARATATWREATCNPPPFFMCNPVPTGATGYSSLVEAFNAGWFHARLIRLRLGSSSGNFGFLNVGDLLGVGNLQLSGYQQLLTNQQNLNGCAVTLDALNTRPGNITSINRWLNTRFGLYEHNSVRGIASDVFVRKGYVMDADGCDGDVDPLFAANLLEAASISPALFNTNGSISVTRRQGNRNITEQNQAMGYPANYSMVSTGAVEIGGATAPSGANGYVWPYDHYLRFNYPTQAQTILNTLTPQVYKAGDSVRNPNIQTPSRHDVYLYELANRATLGNNIRGTDSPLPSCSTGATVPGGRYVYLALADCSVTPPTGASVPVQVTAYGKFFMTNPVLAPNSGAIYGEIIDLSNQGNGTTDDSFRDEAFLVR